MKRTQTKSRRPAKGARTDARGSRLRVLLVCPGAKEYLSILPFFKDSVYEIICQDFGSAKELRGRIQRAKPQMLVLEFEVLGKSTLAFVNELKASSPRLKLLLVGRFRNPSKVAEALQAGADGYFLVGNDVEELADAIEDVMRGCLYISTEILPDMSRQ